MEQSFFSTQFSEHFRATQLSGFTDFFSKTVIPPTKILPATHSSLINPAMTLSSGRQMKHANIHLPQEQNNWAFLDMQNFYKGIQEKGWKIRWAAFRQYLKDVHQVTKAIGFLGYLKEYEAMYAYFNRAGFRLEFRKVMRLANGSIEGGNVDADLASYVMDHKLRYDQAVIVADDSDYCRTIQSLDRQRKLRVVVSPHSMKDTSTLIKQAIGQKKIISIENLKHLMLHVDAA